MKLFVLLLVLVGCGASPEAPRCELGRVQSCPCVGGGQGAQECGPLGVWGVCACGGSDAGSDAASDAAPLCAAVGSPCVCGSIGSACVRTLSGGIACDCPDAGADAASDAPVICVAPFADCDSNTANGCETDTRTSAAHCGACQRPCPSMCSSGVCR